MFVLVEILVNDAAVYGDVRDGEEDDDDKKDDVFSTDEDSGDRIELHLVLPEVEQQVQETAVVRRQEGGLQQVIG